MRNTYYSEPIWNQPKQRLLRSCIDAKGQFDSAKVLRGTFTNRLLGQTGRAVTSFFVLLAWAISPSEVEPTPGELVDYTILQYQFDYICKIYIYMYIVFFLMCLYSSSPIFHHFADPLFVRIWFTRGWHLSLIYTSRKPFSDSMGLTIEYPKAQGSGTTSSHHWIKVIPHKICLILATDIII